MSALSNGGMSRSLWMSSASVRPIARGESGASVGWAARGATVELQCRGAPLRQAFVLVRVRHDLDALDPGRDRRRVAYHACLQLVPLAVLPEARPFVG